MRRFFISILVLITLFFVYMIAKLLPDFYLDLGKKDCAKKDYAAAQKNLGIALKLSPWNRDIRYYYVQALINLKPTQKVQKELFEISQINQADSADLISDQQISRWRNEILSNIGNNYIEQVPYNDKILRWDVTKFPLKVYIKKNSSSAPKYYPDMIKKAFLQWQTSTENFINFKFTNNEKDADILVEIDPSTDMKKCEQEDCKYTVAYTTPTIDNNLLEQMDILFYDSNNLGQFFSQSEVYNTALHEIGHALGIMGHSYDNNSIMYMETNQNNSSDRFKEAPQFISQTDINTLTLLYELIPDITNTPLSKFNTSHQFFAPIILGSDEQINSQKMLEAQNYINSAPNLPNGYIDLASAFVEAKHYNKGIEALNKALGFCSNDDEKFVVYYNFAITYMEIKDWQDALLYANMAHDINASSDVEGLIAMINYNLGNKKLAKEAYQQAIEKNPDNIINSYNLAIIYLRELNLAKAGKVLNNLIKANPEAKNDQRIKAYSLLIFFFR